MRFNWNVSNCKESLIPLISLMEHPSIRNFVDDLPQISTISTFSTKIHTICKNERRTPMKHTYFTTCPYCGATLDPGERCDCPRASPGGYQYGNRTSTEIVPVRKPDRYGNQMGAKNAPMQKVHRCRLCTRTCPACRRSCLAAASSSLTPVRLN